MEQHTTGGVYLNFSPEGQRLVDGFGADKYARLGRAQGPYDPANMFRFNHNIRPGSAPAPRSVRSNHGIDDIGSSARLDGLAGRPARLGDMRCPVHARHPDRRRHDQPCR